ncbi:hypothetical protein CROQUDRAFT_31560, partial [Cronartium quercuum f. sp. fusiforme G11]
KKFGLLKHIIHEVLSSLSDVFISPLENIYFVTGLLGIDLNKLPTSCTLLK